MKESQITEFKASWRDEYLKHICAFANTRGGRLFIGVADDGNVVGVKEIKKLLEDIPNKAINYLGIIVDVHLIEESGKEYLEIVIPQSSVPIAFKGVYYVKSGSTKQELKGFRMLSKAIFLKCPKKSSKPFVLNILYHQSDMKDYSVLKNWSILRML